MIKKALLSLFLGFSLVALFMLSCVTGKVTNNPTQYLATAPLIPKPLQVIPATGEFQLHENMVIQLDDSRPELGLIGEYLVSKISDRTGISPSIKSFEIGPSSIYIIIKDLDSDHPEAYELDITQNALYLSANTIEGAFRGIQTVLQLIDKNRDNQWFIPAGKIIDEPQFSYRGTMLDVSRHFFGVDYLKKYIDILAYYKINYFHLHLSDDQGWRIEIKSWPLLTEIGGSTEVGGGPGGFYTQEEFKEIVAYAASRYITIIPEIDMPGHTNAATASYPILNGNGITPQLYTGKKVGFSTFDTRSDTVYQFVDDVIRELSAISPGPYFHIGGDESHVTEDDDYVYFINRVEKIVQKYGKRMIGWTEVAQADLDSTSIAQYWVHPKKAEMAIEKNMNLILSPAEKTYLDMKYDSLSPFGYNWIGYISVKDAYDWNPEEYFSTSHIMGIEAPLWSENFGTGDSLEFMAFPRLIGIAELGWTIQSHRNWDEYKQRLANQAFYLRRNNINFFASPYIDWPE